MAKEYFQSTDKFPNLTLLLSAPDTLAGKTFRVTTPTAGLALDGRTTDAIISAVFAAQFGGASVPAHVSVRLLANAHAANFGANFDARQAPLGSIGFEIAFGADFAGMEDIPLIFTVAGYATDGLALDDVVLPTLTTGTSDIVVKDIQESAVAVAVVEVSDYSPTTPADWAGAAPTTLAEAIDRLAAAGSPVP